MDKKDIAEICGAMIGDGWIESRESSLYICGNAKEDKDYYDNYLIPLFSKTFHNVIGKEYPYWQVYGFGLHRKKIIKKIINFGVKKGKKVYSINIPSWIFKKKEFMIHVLRGIFDTDGGVSFDKSHDKYAKKFRKKFHHSIRLRISTSSLGLVRGIARIGKILNIPFTSIRFRAGKPTITKNNGDSYIIELNKMTEINRWFSILELSKNPKHISKYLIWKKFGFCPTGITLEERKKILKGIVNPYSYYAGVPE